MRASSASAGAVIPRAVLRNTLLGVFCWWMLSSDPPDSDVLDQIQARGILRVATVEGPLTRIELPEGPAGFEYDLVNELAEVMGLEIRWQVYPTLAEARADTALGNAHLLAASWTPPQPRPEDLLLTVPYREAQYVIAYHADTGPRLRDLGQVAGAEVLIPAGLAWRRLLVDEPPFVAVEQPQSQAELLQRLAAQEVLYALVDTDNLVIAERTNPRLRTGPHLGAPLEKVWAVPRDGGERLWREVDSFLRFAELEGDLARLRHRHFQHLNRLDDYSRRAFRKRVDSRLARFREAFERAAAEYDFDWRFLAAVGYQESAWDPDARSKTGVRGLMMLTRATARELGVRNRTDPEESIDGGARYLRNLHGRVSPEAPEPDRTWMTLAAYNLGLGHLRDLQGLTAELGGDPNRWIDLRANLPKLMQPRWYEDLRYGYARGTEARAYVGNIRAYYDLLRWLYPTAAEAAERERPQTQAAPPPTQAPWPQVIVPGL